MAKKLHVEKLNQGATEWNQWRNDNPDIVPDFSEADLVGKDLREFDLAKANLSGARLHQANLCGADLREANLSKAVLHKADLYRAKLSEADLSGANLSGANLYRADLHENNLAKADLREARLLSANLRGANLYKAELQKAKLNSANLREANLRGALLFEAELCGADVRGADIIEADFGSASVDGLKIDRIQSDSLDPDKFPPHKKNIMDIKYNLGELRKKFSGMWAWIHGISLFLFLAPYAVVTIRFIAEDLIVHAVEARNLDFDGAEKTMLICRLLTYIFDPWWWAIVPVLLAYYNYLRFALLRDTKRLEYNEYIQGFASDFSFETEDGSKIQKRTKSLDCLFRWSIPILIIHTLYFLAKEISYFT
jgi:uncharacterized protein YjbI with pentapeptide repeats